MVIDNFVITSSKGGSVGQQVFGSRNYTNLYIKSRIKLI